MGADASSYGVLRSRDLSQVGSAPPLESSALYAAISFIREGAPESLLAGTLQIPGSKFPVILESEPPFLVADLGFADLAELEAGTPAGVYTMMIVGMADLVKTVSLDFAGCSFPPVPHIANQPELEGVDPDAAFEVRWDVWGTGGVHDFIYVEIEDVDGEMVYRSPFLGAPGALPGTATAVTVPGGALVDGVDYEVRVSFMDLSVRDTTSYPGAVGVAGCMSQTSLEFTAGEGGGGGTDTTPPTLAATLPANMAVGVATDVLVRFTFSEPMQEDHAVSWGPMVAEGNFTYWWSSDSTTLHALYLGGFPADSLITWTLNPVEQPGGFKDVAGNPLAAGVYSGSFVTAGGSDPCEPVDTGEGYILLSRMLMYEQTSNAAPVPAAETPAAGSAGVTSPTNHPLSSVTLIRPGQAGESMMQLPPPSRFFAAFEDFATEAGLAAAWPAGSYRFVAPRAGAATVDVTLTMTDEWPPIPRIVNWEEAQAVDETQDFTLNWNGFPGAGERDYLGVTLMGPNGFHWTAPDSCVPRELANTATSVVIPANSLPADTVFSGDLTYSRQVDPGTTGVPDMGSGAMLFRTVRFTLITGQGSSGDQPVITRYESRPDGRFYLEVKAAVGQQCTIEASTDLTGWTPVFMGMVLPSGVMIYEDAAAAGMSWRFYRARTP